MALPLVAIATLLWPMISIQAAPVRIAVTGDSQASSYWFTLSLTLAADKFPFAIIPIVSGGATSAVYTGQAIDVNATPQRFHNFAADALAANVDVVLITMGAADAVRNQFDQFNTDMTSVLTMFTTAAKPPRVIFPTNIPLLASPDYAYYAAGNDRLNTQFNPLIASTAATFGATVLDLGTLIQQQPGWQNWYSDNAQSPGYAHLWGQPLDGFPGLQWEARQLANAIEALYIGQNPRGPDGPHDGPGVSGWYVIPELSTGNLALVALCCCYVRAGLIRRRRTRIA